MTRRRWPSARALAGAALTVGILLTATTVVAQHAVAASGSLHLLGQSSAVEPDADLVVRVQSDGAPSDALLRLTVYSRARTRSGFQLTLEGHNLGRPIAPALFSPAVVDGATTATVVIHTAPGSDAPAVTFPEEGVFPMTIELVANGGAVLDQLLTYVVRLPLSHDAAPLEVASVVPMGGPPAAQPDGSLAVDPDVRTRFLDRAAALGEHAGAPLTIAASPESVSSFNESGDANPANALRLAAVGRQVVTEPFVDVDVAAWLNRDLRSELSDEVNEGTAVLEAAGASPSGSTWIASAPLSTNALEWLRDRGVRNVVVPEDGLSTLDSRRFPATLTQPFAIDGVDGVTVAVADSGLPSHLRAGDDPLVAANHLLADLAILFFDQPTATRMAIVVVPETASREALDAMLDGLRDNRMFHPTTLDAAFARVPVVGARGEPDGRKNPLTRKIEATPNSLGSFPSRLQTAETTVSSYRDAVGPTDPHTIAVHHRLLAAGAATFDDARRNEHLDGISRFVHDEFAKVEVPRRQSITFTARDGVVSFVLRNRAGYPMNVVVRFTGTKVKFPDHPDGSLTATLAGETTRIDLNVRTLASGDTPVDLRVTTPDGRVELGRTRVTIRSTAFSGVGIVLSIGAGLFLVLWWGKHILDTRRARRRTPRHLRQPESSS